jgi:hypothetical protein
MTHIKMIICKQLLKDKQKQVMATIKPRTKTMSATEHHEIYKSAKDELEAIEAELWILNNW